ncbi:MAG: metallophosphoesterase [Clostridiales bacterium]|nr:metallophosphoesterase [Clostridiales bacterium]
MKLERSTLEIGLERPVKLLHVTDTHLALCDERDNERKREMARRRTSMAKALRYLEEHIAYAEENCDLLVHTGDLIDFVSRANVEKAREILKNDRIFFIAGNHEYSQYMGEAWEDNAYRMNSYMEIDRMGGFGSPMLWNTRVVGGVNIVGMDNSYYLFEDWHIEKLKTEVEKGLPVILAFHDPLFEESLYRYHFERVPGEPCAYLVGCDEEHLGRYSEFRAVQQRPDAPTLRMIGYIRSEPRIKAVLTGHLHFSFVSDITPSLPQFVTGGGYEGIAREITVV